MHQIYDQIVAVSTYLRFVTTELSMAVCQALQPYRELHVATPHDILDFKFGKLGDEAQLLHDPSILA
jgi:hypothetical protein